MRFLIELKNKIEHKKRQELNRKYFEIRGEVIKFYEDKEETEQNADLPAFMRADNILKEVIRTPKDVNFYYGLLLKYRRKHA